MGCNAWNHVNCNCGWGGSNYGRARTPARDSLSLSAAREVWRSFVNPNARCPECQEPVSYYQSENGGRVFFDHLGWPWPKHPCTDRASWRWPTDTGFRLNDYGAKEPGAPSSWQAGGWVPVAKVERTADRFGRKVKDNLSSAIVWSAEDASELKVLWPMNSNFNWSGPVMMRPDPRSPHRVEFETIWWDVDAARVERLVAVKNDILTTMPTLLSRLRDKR
jgi:hypothetical protein